MVSQIINLMDEMDDKFFSVAYSKINSSMSFHPLSWFDINPNDYLLTIIQYQHQQICSFPRYCSLPTFNHYAK